MPELIGRRNIEKDSKTSSPLGRSSSRSLNKHPVHGNVKEVRRKIQTSYKTGANASSDKEDAKVNFKATQIIKQIQYPYTFTFLGCLATGSTTEPWLITASVSLDDCQCSCRILPD